MKKDILKKIGEVNRTVVNHDTGELLSETSESSYFLANSDKEFYLMYASMLTVLKTCKDPKINLLAGLIERYSKGQEFSMSRSLKNLIAKETKSNSRTFDRAFTALREDGLIIETDYRLYKLNPKYVFQGSTATRNNHLKAVLVLERKRTEDGR